MPHRILYIHHGGTIGGAPLSLLFLLQQLDRERYAPVVVFSADGPVIQRYKDAGIETHIEPRLTDFSHTELVWYGRGLLWMLPGKLLRYPGSVKATRRLVQRFRPNLVHVNSSALAAAAQGAALEGVPVVWHIREPLAPGYTGLRRAWLRRRIDQDATRVIAISAHDAGKLIPSERIRVIHNFVHFEVFDRSIPAGAARERLRLSPAQHVVTMLGGVSQPKGTLPFVQALPLVRKAIPNVRFLVVGPPPAIGDSRPLHSLAKFLMRGDAYDRAVMAAASEHLDRGFIRFTGVRQDIPQVLAASDLLVFPSVVPHFARPIIEAGAMAKPVVASDLGGPAELVVDGETGLLVPPNDPQALAEAIVAILSHPKRARAMGEAGFVQASERFEALANAQATFRVYEEILSGAS